MKFLKASIAATLLAATVGCTGSSFFREARDAEERGQWDLAVMKLARAVESNPGNPQFKLSLQRAKLRASQAHFDKGKLYRSSGNPELAILELEQAVVLDPTNDYASVELRKAREDFAKLQAERNGETRMEKLKKKARGARPIVPILEPSSDKPINLNFPQPKPIKQIYRALADAAGINIIFDPQLKDDNVSIVLNGLEFQKALETLIRQENHFYKIIDERTILVAADTPQNRKTYEDLVIRTFFLSNADVTEVANALRALLQTTRISVNKAENSITLRDTADKVAIAERIVEQNDKQVAEVVVDVELLQVNTTKLLDLGPLLGYSIGATVPAPGGTTNLGAPLPSGAFSWDQLKKLAISSLGFTIPSVTYNFIKNNSDADLLAKPQLRVAEGQKAQLVIGDKVPIPVTSFNTSTTTTGGAIVPVTSFQYQDVGIKIEVEPRVHHNKEITLKLMVEVSQLGAPVTYGGTSQPTIGTRTISSNIRLKDGETNLLAGLFRRDRANATDEIPFASQIPILGALISHNKRQTQTTDLVLTLTPHIIRIPDVTAEDLEPVYVGTDANISYQGTPRVESPSRDMGPFDATTKPGAPPPPRTTPPPTTGPPAINLAPSGGPTDIFKPPPPPPTPPPPRQSIPPQGASAETSASPASRDAASVAVTAAASVASEALLLDFDPAYLALRPGQQQSVLVRATSSAGFPGGALTVRFDPSIAAAMAVRPILAGIGAADAQIGNGVVVIDLPAASDLSGTRAIAEITVQGVAAGRSAWSLDSNDALGSSVTRSQLVIEVR
jgi:general secretion pathway protein D